MKSWAVAVLPLIAIAALLGVAPHFGIGWRAGSFVATTLLLATELALIGWLMNNRAIGAFIDNRNRISLSKLQAGAWTVLVLGALATAAAFNTIAPDNGTGYVSALAVQIPGELLLAMGISATSLVGTPMLLSLKSDQPAVSQGAVDAAGDKLASQGLDKTQVGAKGHLLHKSDAAHARWADLFTGEEVGNAGYPDLGKIQQVLITLLLLGIYAAYIYVELARSTTVVVSSLPTLDPSFVWLLGISHATYLAYKAAPHTSAA